MCTLSAPKAKRSNRSETSNCRSLSPFNRSRDRHHHYCNGFALARFPVSVSEIGSGWAVTFHFTNKEHIQFSLYKTLLHNHWHVAATELARGSLDSPMALVQDMPIDACMKIAQSVHEQTGLQQLLRFACTCRSAREAVNEHLSYLRSFRLYGHEISRSVVHLLSRISREHTLQQLSLLAADVAGLSAGIHNGCVQLDLTRSWPASAIATLVHACKPQLQAVDLSAIQGFNRSVCSALCDGCELSELYLASVSVEAPLEFAVRMLLAQSSCLRYLDVSSSSVLQHALAMVLNNNTQALSHLEHLAACWSTSHNLIRALADGACPRLQHIDLSGCDEQLTDALLSEIASQHPKVEHFDVNYTYVSTAIDDVLLNCRKQLRRIDVHFSLITLPLLTQAVQRSSKLPVLTALSCNAASGDDHAFRELAQSLHDAAPSLQILMLFCTSEAYVSDSEAASVLPRTLRSFFTDSTPSPSFIASLGLHLPLQHLALSASKMQRWHLQILAQQCRNVEELELENVNKTTSKHLAELAPLHGLRKLLITGNCRDQSELAVLLRKLDALPSLLELRVICTAVQPTNELLHAVQYRKSMMRHGKRLAVYFNFNEI